MTHDALYHYTDADSLADILRDGVIRARSQRVYRDLIPREERSREIGPLVWLTINPILDGTVAVKMRAAGRELVGPHGLRRIVLPYVCDVGLADYCDARGIDQEWLTPLVQTGAMCGSDYTCWRLLDRDAPASEWLRVEALTDLAAVSWEPA